MVKNRRGRAGPTLQPRAYREIQRLCKAAKNYGQASTFFSSLIHAAFTAYLLTPHDLQRVMTVLLSPAEFTLWKRGWKRLLNQLLLIKSLVALLC